ncbi:uncharacterized protein LOC135525829 isoform X6 [Oncorhynchus masou masou]|uniref:uncharacterized protein LOC135525829 isoform X6 n=1 Tax=Oncorhynchus masou masou TaxID=90313 RepID=UPI003183995E
MSGGAGDPDLLPSHGADCLCSEVHCAHTFPEEDWPTRASYNLAWREASRSGTEGVDRHPPAAASEFGDPMCGLQGRLWLLSSEAGLLESGMQSSEATHLAGSAGTVVGHHRTPAQVPWTALTRGTHPLTCRLC